MAAEAGEEIEDWIGTLFSATSKHEGTYWSVQRNLDGQGVSYGFIQWTQLAGGLGRVLTTMYRADPIQFAADFGPHHQALLTAVTSASQSERMAPVGGVNLWESSWVERFQLAGGRYAPVEGDADYRPGDPQGDRRAPKEKRSAANRRPQFQAAQRNEAASSEYLIAAKKIAGLLGVRSERAMTMYYNRTVHQGAAGAVGPAEVLAAWYRADPSRRPANQNDVLAQYAWRCAAKFRKVGAPENMAYNKSGLVWKPVTTEYSELRTGNYAVAKVAAPPNTYHVFAAGFPVSLYDLITMRSSEILLNPKLRDAPVNLDVATAPASIAGVPPATHIRRRVT